MSDKINWGRTPDLLAAQLHVAQSRIYSHFNEWFSALELTPKQFGVLYMISLNPGANQRSLAALHSMGRAAFGEALTRLEERGLIARIPSSADRRSKKIVISDQGQKALDIILADIADQEKASTSALSDSERHLLLALLLKLNRPTPQPDAERA